MIQDGRLGVELHEAADTGRGWWRRGRTGSLLGNVGACARDRRRWGANVRSKGEALSPDAPWGVWSMDLRPAAGTQAAASSGGPARDGETRLLGTHGKRLTSLCPRCCDHRRRRRANDTSPACPREG
ncbi:hypothetical protein NDU88_009714 [Pleurodeles waltl]|uniref:Uncharacterized protein n=1 Tax=Pleurodeles waltl TaxID=8319 RepID=A0AAV7QYB0_PLEWA|nr:hypothetical protein NDU88_009714 [Pleurodeles waltl]